MVLRLHNAGTIPIHRAGYDSTLGRTGVGTVIAWIEGVNLLIDDRLIAS
jgi:hypothetical protein